MQMRTATAADLLSMGERSVSRGCLGDIPDTTDYVYALEHDGELLAVGGIHQMNPTCAWAWLDLAARALENQVILLRIIRDYIDDLMTKRGLTRLMAAVEEDFAEAIRFAEWLGFERESRMPKWHGDKAAYLYVRLAGG